MSDEEKPKKKPRKRSETLEAIWALIVYVWITFPRIVGICMMWAYVDTGAREVVMRELGEGATWVKESEFYQANMGNLKDWWNR